MTRIKHRTALFMFAANVAAVLLLQACWGDEPTSPVVVHRELTGPSVATLADSTISQQTIPMPSAWKTDSGSQVTLPDFPHYTLIKVTATGVLTAEVANVNHVPPDNEFVVQPGGFWNGQSCKV